MPFFLGHSSNESNDNIQVQKSLELRSIIDCPRHDFSGEGVLNLRCEPVLVPTVLPEGSAADMGVNLSDHRVVDIHPGGHLLARCTILEQSKDISLCSTGHIGWGCNCTEGVLCIVEGQVI